MLCIKSKKYNKQYRNFEYTDHIRGSSDNFSSNIEKIQANSIPHEISQN